MPSFASIGGFRIYFPRLRFHRLFICVFAALILFLFLIVTLRPDPSKTRVYTIHPQLKLPSDKDSLAFGFEPLNNPAIAREVQEYKLRKQQEAADSQEYIQNLSPPELQQRARQKLAEKTKKERLQAAEKKAAKIKFENLAITQADSALNNTSTTLYKKNQMSFSAAGITLKSKVKLSSGYEMPILGFGVYQSYGEEVINSVYHALKTGYRHIDSATLYENEREVGVAVKKWIHDTGGKREEIFYTTKIWDTDQGMYLALPSKYTKSLINIFRLQKHKKGNQLVAA